MKRFLTFQFRPTSILAMLSLLCVSLMSFGQIVEPVKWTQEVKPLGNGEYELTFKASIDDGWYLYAQDLEEGGPLPTVFDFEEAKGQGVSLEGKIAEKGKVIEGIDPIFEMMVRKYKKEVDFVAKVKANGDASFNIPVDFMSCNDESCVKLSDDFDIALKGAAASTPAKTEAGSTVAPAKEVKGAAEEKAKEAVPTNTTEGKKSKKSALKDKLKKKGSKKKGKGALKDRLKNKSNGGEDAKNIIAPNPNTKKDDAAGGLLDPVKWSYDLEDLGNGEYLVKVNAKIDEGWYVYSQDIGEGGPEPTEFTFDKSEGVTLIGDRVEEVSEHRKAVFDNIFKMDVVKYTDEVSFQQKVKLASPDTKLSGSFLYQTCDDKQCLKPTVEEFAFNDDSANDAAALAAGDMKGTNPFAKGSGSDNAPEQEEQKTPWGIFIAGFLGGLVALVTPCVFPMIPLTVSFFTKSSKTRAAGIRNGTLYALSIIGIYVGLGVFITLVFGATAMNEFATNPWVNIAFFLIFVFFAFSFFGYYEIQLPTWLANKADQAADRGGLMGIFFMAATLSIVSFSCTGPIIGSLIVQAAQGGIMGPALGMLGFAVALAFPFAFFAAFPSYLNSLPQSGGWLNSVKVVLGFLELAFAFKFLSNADLVMQWGLLKRETFLIIWFICFFLLGLYFLAKIKFPHDSPVKKLGGMRLGLAAITFAFCGYLLYGVPCNALGLISGFPPPDFYSYTCGDDGDHCPLGLPCMHDYEKGLAKAKATGKPLLIDFTGWACVNCRRMEENVWSVEDVKKVLEEDVVLVSLYVDEKKELKADDQYDYVDSKGKKKRVVTVGDKWAQMQINCFQSNSQPKYVLLDHNEKMLKKESVGYTSVDNFRDFLSSGISNFGKGVSEAEMLCRR